MKVVRRADRPDSFHRLAELFVSSDEELVAALSLVSSTNFSVKAVVLQLPEKRLPLALVETASLEDWEHGIRIMNLECLSSREPTNYVVVALHLGSIKHLVKTDREGELLRLRFCKRQ